MEAIHDITNARVILEDDSDVCFYTDKFNVDPDYPCSDGVVPNVVEMFNGGKSLMDIDDYLLYADCSQEVREVIVEGLYLIYQKNLDTE